MQGQLESGQPQPLDPFDKSVAALKRLDTTDAEIVRLVRLANQTGESLSPRDAHACLTKAGTCELYPRVRDRIDALALLGLLIKEPDGLTLGYGSLVLGEVS